MASRNRKLLVNIKDELPVWTLVEEEIPKAPKNGIVVRVTNAGVCHSDAHMAQTAIVPGFVFPRVFGHEVAGIVHDIGGDLTEAEFAKDDRVIVFPWGNCNNCSVCHNDLPYCGVQADPTVDHSDSFVYGVWRDGGFQNYMVVHEKNMIIKVPDAVRMDVAAMVPCSGTTAYNAVSSLRNSIDTSLRINGKAAVGVMGAGGLALWAIQIVKCLYPQNVQVVAIDINEEKLEDAVKQGADKTFKWGISGEPMAIAGEYFQKVGLPLDGIIDFTGIADCQARAFFLLNVGGTLALVGIGKDPTPGFHLLGSIFKNITIKALITGSRKQCKELIKLIGDGKVKSPPIKEIKLEDVENSIAQMNNNTIRGRHVVKF